MTTPSTRQDYGYHHQLRRARALPAAIGTECPGPDGPRSPRCTGTIQPDAADWDHTTGRIICSHCNRYHGARIGAARRWAHRTTTQRHSRNW